MNYPSELINYIETELKKDHSYRNYAETVDMYYGKITIHIWSIGFHFTDDKEAYEIKEVYRENETSQRINSDFYFVNLGGWQTLWTAKKYAYYGMVYPTNKMEKWHGKKPNLAYVKHLWDYQDIRKLDPSLKYFYVDENESQVDLIEFIKTWRKYPVLEILSKQGIHYFYTDKRVLELQGKKKQLFTNWIKNNRDYVIENKPPYNEIISCANKHISPQQYQANYGMETLKRKLNAFGYNEAEVKDINSYLKKRYYSKGFYKDYIEMCFKEKMNIHDRGVMFPKDLRNAHDQMSRLVEAHKNYKHDKSLAKISKTLNPIAIQDNEFSVMIPKSQGEIIRVGEALHNCVGRCNYGTEMAKGKIIIAVVCKDNEYLECCELQKQKDTLSIVQLRGDHNCDSKYHKEAKQVIRSFIERYTDNKMSLALN